MLNRKTDFITQFGNNMVEVGRNAVKINPITGPNYNSKSIQDIQFEFPSQSYMDPQSGFLSFRFNLRRNKIKSATAEVINVVPDNVSAVCPFNKAVLLNSLDSVITNEAHVQEVALHKLHQKGEQYVNSVGKNAMGYSSEFERLQYDDVTAATLGIATVASQSGMVIPTAADAVAGADVLSEVVQYAVPLSVLSSVFSVDTYLPLKYMSNKSSALKLVLSMNEIRQALFAYTATSKLDKSVTGAGTISTATGDALLQLIANHVNLSYDLQDVAIYYDSVILSAESDALIKQAVDSTGVSFMFVDNSQFANSGYVASANNHVVNINKFSMSIAALTFQLREVNCRQDIALAVSWQGRYGLNQAQSFIGTAAWPISPIDLKNLNYNGASYLLNAQNTKANGSLNAVTKAFMPYFNKYKAGSFELTFDYTPKEFEYIRQTTFNGKDTRSSSSLLSIQLQRSNANVEGVDPSYGTFTKPLEVLANVESENLLLVKAGQAVASEK